MSKVSRSLIIEERGIKLCNDCWMHTTTVSDTSHDTGETLGLIYSTGSLSVCNSTPLDVIRILIFQRSDQILSYVRATALEPTANRLRAVFLSYDRISSLL